MSSIMINHSTFGFGLGASAYITTLTSTILCRSYPTSTPAFCFHITLFVYSCIDGTYYCISSILQ